MMVCRFTAHPGVRVQIDRRVIDMISPLDVWFSGLYVDGAPAESSDRDARGSILWHPLPYRAAPRTVEGLASLLEHARDDLEKAGEIGEVRAVS